MRQNRAYGENLTNVKPFLSRQPVYTGQFDHYFIPAQRQRTLRPKLIVVMHGRGDSLNPFKRFDRELDLGEANYLLLNAPRKYLDGYTWYAFPPHQARGVLQARKRLRILFFELEAQGWDLRDVFLLGFSQGCLVGCDFGMTFHKPFGGVVGISGYIYFFSGWRKRLPPAAF